MITAWRTVENVHRGRAGEVVRINHVSRLVVDIEAVVDAVPDSRDGHLTAVAVAAGTVWDVAVSDAEDGDWLSADAEDFSRCPAG